VAGPVPATGSAFITRLERPISTVIVPAKPDNGEPGGGPTHPGLRLAVKDAIDVAGVPTTAGSRVVADRAEPAPADADCLAGARTAGVTVVGKANLHELCFGASGVNPWFGTPVNPLDPHLIPGGSSSGSAVAVADGDADVAFGTDTAGSIRNPAACCGVVGLKTTWGRIPMGGVWPLAPSLDTVGPLARTVDLLEQAMALLEPGFARSATGPGRVGRIRGLPADPAIDGAVDAALAATGWEVVPVELPGWAGAHAAAVTVLLGEALATHRGFVAEHLGGLGADVAARFEWARTLPPTALGDARNIGHAWRAELAHAFARFDLLALPTMLGFPPRLVDEAPSPNSAAAAVNLAGHPALALPVPVPAGGALPASLQLVGPDGSEELLVAAGLVVEAAAPAAPRRVPD